MTYVARYAIRVFKDYVLGNQGGTADYSVPRIGAFFLPIFIGI